MKIIDFVKQHDKRLVSPIWWGEQAFHFLCLGHLDISKALGFELEQATPVLTVVKAGQVKTEEDLDRIIAEHKWDMSPMESEVANLRRMKQEEGDFLCGGGCFGPLTVVSGILGAENLLRLVVKNPALVEKFLAYVTEYMIELAKREREEGQQFFWMAEPVASLLAPKRFWQFSGKYLKEIYDAAGASGMLHVCGPTLKHTPYMVETGAEVLSIDYCTDIGECIRMVPEDVVIMGNVSPSLLRLGSKEEVEEEVDRILAAVEGFPNFVMSTGCSIMGGTTEENMLVLFDKCK